MPTREHLLNGQRTECWDEKPVSGAPEPVVMVRSEYAFGYDIFQLCDCAGWEFDNVPARTEFIGQLVSVTKSWSSPPKRSLKMGPVNNNDE